MTGQQARLEDKLETLMAIPSVSGDREACWAIIHSVHKELAPLGLHVELPEDNTDNPWLFATTQLTREPTLLLVAHLDVVKASTEDQYRLTKDKEWLRGRGVLDMKYAAAAYLEFFEEHKALLDDLDVGLLFTTDEEIGGYKGSAEVLASGVRTKLAFIPDYGPDWKIEDKAKGFCSTEILADGKSAHSSRPWEGDNSVQRLILLLHDLMAAYPSEDNMGSTVSINVFNGGQAFNQIPSQASAKIDFRSFDRNEIDNYKQLLTELTQKYGASIGNVINGSPVVLDKQNQLVQRYIDSLRALGKEPEYQVSFGGTDARWFADYDIPSIVTGPRGENAHGADERIRRSDLLLFYKLLGHFVLHNTKVSYSSYTTSSNYIG